MTQSHHDTRIICCCLLLICLAPVLIAQTGDAREWRLGDYVQRAVEVSPAVEAAERSVESAQDRLAETRLAGATVLDLKEAENAVEIAQTVLAEKQASVSYQAATLFVNHLRVLRSNEFARRQLEVKLRAEGVSRQRYDEGVKTEDSYLSDVTARLNAELALMKSDQSVEASRRGLFRLVSEDPSSQYTVREVRLPYVELSLAQDDLVAELKLSSATYQAAAAAADIARRKFEAVSRLTSSMTEKEIAEARDAAEAADRNLESAISTIEDQAWQLLSTLAIETKNVEIGEQLYAVSTKSWGKRQEQFDFGLISEIELESFRLAYDQSRDQAIRKIEDHYLQVLKIEQLRGNDLLDVLARDIE